MKMNTTIATTKKGKRVFLENVGRNGQRYDVLFGDDITIVFRPTGKRAVVASKGGVIDLESQKVARWANDATVAHIHGGMDTIVITRGQ